jgi:hypothetical protein
MTTAATNKIAAAARSLGPPLSVDLDGDGREISYERPSDSDHDNRYR